MKLSDKLKSLNLDSVTLAWGATGFNLSGKVDGKYLSYELSTMFEICFDKEDVFQTDIFQHPSTVKFWEYFNKCLLDIVISEDGRVCVLKFEGNKSIYVWSEEHKHDNLFVVKNCQADEWFTIG